MNYIHGLDLIISFLSIIIISIIIFKKKYNDYFIQTMLFMFLSLMINIFIFSLAYLIDIEDGKLFSDVIFGYWTLIIRLQNCITVLWVSYLAWKRVRK